jgi:hypothetical protein
MEALVLYSLLIGYKLVRGAVRDHVDEAFAHAHAVMGFERRLGSFFEPWLQHQVLDHRWLVQALNQYYVNVHLLGSALVLLALWVLAPAAYVRTRNVMVVLSASALVLHVLYPLAPPRMFPGAGFVDTGRLIGPSPYSNGTLRGLANQYAAMPSLHFGWALLLAWAVFRATDHAGRWRRLRWLIVAHPVATGLVVILTANHYWLDLFVAGVLFVGAVAIEPSLGRMWASTVRQLRPAGPVPVPPGAAAFTTATASGRPGPRTAVRP